MHAAVVAAVALHTQQRTGSPSRRSSRPPAAFVFVEHASSDHAISVNDERAETRRQRHDEI
jgi:hypothetical protein